MNEKPQSIWKRSFKGPRGLLAAFLLLASVLFVVLFAIGAVSAGNNSTKDLLTFSLAISIGVPTALVLIGVFFRWAFCKRNLRRSLFGLACLATLIALFYAEENWRGKHAWQKYQREHPGERFDIKSLAPSPVPDDQNFAVAPIWVEEVSGMIGADKAETWYGDRVAALGHTNFSQPLEMPVELRSRLDFANKTAIWPNAEKVDLKAWQEYYRQLVALTNYFPSSPLPQTAAKDVLLALSKYDSNIEELRNASQRLYSRFPVAYTDDNPASILLPHLSALKSSVILLQLRAVAELEAGQVEKALEDVKLMLRLTESIRGEPIIISHLVRAAMLRITIQPIWEGLAGRHWNEAQLAALDAELAKLDFLADYAFSMRGERAFGIGVIDFVQRNRKEIKIIAGFEFTDSSVPTHESLFDKVMLGPLNRFIPRGWFEQNKISICRMHDRYVLPAVNMETKTFSVPGGKRSTPDMGSSDAERSPFNWFTALILSSLDKFSEKFARAQWALDSARIACSLERYRLAHGDLPDTLAPIAPQFLQIVPHDVIGGGPLHYRRTEDGQFVLYSVGWNETDDGGMVALGNEKTPSVDAKKGDWVWKYPAK